MDDDDRRRSIGDGDHPTEAELKSRWAAVASDPDFAADLGYALEELDVLVTSNSDKKVMVLPRAKDRVEDDAYLIADFELAKDPVEHA